MPGTPGSRWGIRSDREPWAERGLRLLFTERPGFGASTRLPGRGFAEHAHDVAAILDHQGIDRVFVMGGSGGSPHVLAFCALHPERVRAATILVGSAPMEDDEVGSMIELNQKGHWLAVARDFEGMYALTDPIREQLLADPMAAFRGIMAEAPPADQAVMNDPGWQESFVRGLREALVQGSDGWIDEGIALDSDWTDFAPADVATSVTWYHAAGDANCPLTAAQRLVDQLPDARLVEWADGGHLTGYHKEAEILDELLARG
jgi:pimeloyl-ACP methyl ester carboxylesterase